MSTIASRPRCVQFRRASSRAERPVTRLFGAGNARARGPGGRSAGWTGAVPNTWPHARSRREEWGAFVRSVCERPGPSAILLGRAAVSGDTPGGPPRRASAPSNSGVARRAIRRPQPGGLHDDRRSGFAGITLLEDAGKPWMRARSIRGRACRRVHRQPLRTINVRTVVPPAASQLVQGTDRSLAVGDPQLAQSGRDMTANRDFRNAKPCRDITRRHIVARELQDLRFTGRQRDLTP
jgi:hypothetical protein